FVALFGLKGGEAGLKPLHLAAQNLQFLGLGIVFFIAGRAVGEEVLGVDLGVHQQRLGRVADHGRAFRHVLGDDGVGPDAGALADDDGAENLGVGPDDRAVRDGGVALAALAAGGVHAAQRDALIHGDIMADVCGFTDHYAHAVVDEQVAPDLRAGVNLDAGQEAPELRDRPRQPVEPASVQG